MAGYKFLMEDSHILVRYPMHTTRFWQGKRDRKLCVQGLSCFSVKSRETPPASGKPRQQDTLVEEKLSGLESVLKTSDAVYIILEYSIKYIRARETLHFQISGHLTTKAFFT